MPSSTTSDERVGTAHVAPKIVYAPDELVGVPELWRGDVVVVGGGSAGSTAAVAAARTGARTLLLESGGFLGGTGTRVLDTFYGFYVPGVDSPRVVGGIGWEVCERLAAVGASFERPNTYGAGTGVTYDPETLKVVWDELVLESGATLLFYALVTAVVVDGVRVVGVVAETRQGPRVVYADVVVDASGEAEVAWRVDATVDSLPSPSGLQPATATFRIAGVAEESAGSKRLHELLRAAADSGAYRLPRLEGSTHVTTVPGVRHANMTRVAGKDLTDPWQLTWAEQEGRRQVLEYVRFLQDLVPGYSDARLVSVSPRLGVRESRRLDGEYVLDRDDFLDSRTHPDDIGVCGQPLEDHGAGSATRWEYVGGGPEPTGRAYGIPLGTLVPRAVDGLLVAGRCLSATHEAHASVRSIGQCMTMGHAAGITAAIAADTGAAPRSVDRRRVRRELAAAGAIL